LVVLPVVEVQSSVALAVQSLVVLVALFHLVTQQLAVQSLVAYFHLVTQQLAVQSLVVLVAQFLRSTLNLNILQHLGVKKKLNAR
jgi:uncharacterized membrane protein required for colicin V production